MNTIILRTTDRPNETRTNTDRILVKDLVAEYQDQLPYPILMVRKNGKPIEFSDWIEEDCTIDLLDLRDNYANIAYQNSLTLVLLKAVHDLYGDSVSVTIENSLSGGLFTNVHLPRAEDRIASAIEARMKALIQKDLPFVGRTCTKEELLHKPGESRDRSVVKLVKSAVDLNEVREYTLQNERAYFFQNLLDRTSRLSWFEFIRHKGGYLLRFPLQKNPTELPAYKAQPLLYRAFAEANDWGHTLRVNNAGELNEAIRNGRSKEIVLLCAALHERCIVEIAKQIKKEKKRIILIAGPSSSGKTSFANRLRIQLAVCGLRTLYLGTDDYFLDRKDTPLDEKGEPNFEDLTALDIDLFESNLKDLLAGKKVDLPTYDFKAGKKVYGQRITAIDPNQPILIEGIHGLNPKLTETIAENEKFRIYISPLTQMVIDDHNRFPTTDARLLRRIVRDARTRNYSAEQTIHAWRSVRAGEERNIFPYCNNADAFFNSCVLYEPTVLKRYVEPALQAIPQTVPEYADAQRLLKLLSCFNTMEMDSHIPMNSILREFIGGSILLDG